MSYSIFTPTGSILTMSGVQNKKSRHVTLDDLDEVKSGAIVTRKNKIVWVGNKKDIPNLYRNNSKTIKIKGDILPGFIECHTHLVFAGDRSHEFEQRNQGVTYQEIAKNGGGIRYTVRQTQSESLSNLTRLAKQRAKIFLEQGVTVLEAKSGYGLTLKDEIKILQASQKMRTPKVINTCLALHAIPAEQSREKYVSEVINKWLPMIDKKKLAKRADIFVEQNYFDQNDLKKLVAFCQKHNWTLAVHADQMSAMGTSALAASVGANSVEHAIFVKDEEIDRLANSECTVVLLPTSDFYLKMEYPRAREMIDQGVRVAIATDFNPGTAPSASINFAGVLARLNMKMSLPEVIAAYTVGAAHALGIQNTNGAILPDFYADWIVVPSWKDLFYQVGHHPIEQVWVGGRPSFIKNLK